MGVRSGAIRRTADRLLAHVCPETVTGVVVVVVTDEPEDVDGVEPEDVVEPEALDVDGVVRADTDAARAPLSPATTTPRPIAADVAAIPMATVIRRTRTMARSLATPA